MQQAEELEGDAKSMGFSPSIPRHNSTGYSINIDFDKPEFLNIGGTAELQLHIKEVSLFRSLKTLKPLDESAFVSGKPELRGPLPPIIDDPVSAEELQ